jgi:hypothetical protein
MQLNGWRVWLLKTAVLVFAVFAAHERGFAAESVAMGEAVLASAESADPIAGAAEVRSHYVDMGAVLAVRGGGGGGGEANCRFCDADVINCGYVLSHLSEFTAKAIANCDGEELWWEDNYHAFPTPDESCDPQTEFGCRACGGPNSTCHTEWDVGSCHQPCSGEEQLAALKREIQLAALSGGSARLVHLITNQASVTFDVAANVIELSDPCLGLGEAMRIKVSARTAEQISLALAQQELLW